jgi:antitoxin MazE
MKTTAKIVAIGNSKGVRLPKRLIDELQLTDIVELESHGNELVIRPIASVHEGWEESAQAMHRLGADRLLLGDISTSDWDENEWKW